MKTQIAWPEIEVLFSINAFFTISYMRSKSLIRRSEIELNIWNKYFHSSKILSSISKLSAILRSVS
uniref:Ovule protein n=1 Tax=Parascaris univalens TaxID=6257 RepID=A0A915CLH6_PARUN